MLSYMLYLRLIFGLSSRYLLVKCVSTFLGKKAENHPKCEVTKLHYYINL